VNFTIRLLLTTLLTLICFHEIGFAEEPWTGKQSEWNGFVRYDFQINDRPVLVVTPRESAPGKPWVWHGEFFGHKPAPDIALLEKGFHIVYTQISNQFGSPTAVSHWNEVYKSLTEKHSFASKAALVGVSRGGLFCYNWASQNPDKVACIYGDAPVCDAKSWPMGKGKGVGSANEVRNLLNAYGVETEEQLFAKLLNPIDTLKPLAEAHVPLLHVYGDADEVVPWDENTKVLADRYKSLGGQISLINQPGVGHVHGLSDSTPIIEFIERQCLPAINAPATAE
jgi:pimeloyl-ACP methyl ester carboxylesterase